MQVSGRGQAPLHFKEETIALCHPERSAGSRSGERSCAALRMTKLKRLRLTRTSSYLKWQLLGLPFLWTKSLPAALLRIVHLSATTILKGHFSFQLVPRLACLFDRPLVLNGRDVAWLTIERDGTQHTAHDLAAACLGQRTHIIDLADHHHRTQFTAHRAQQFLLQVLRGLIPLPEHDKRRNHFAAQFIGTTNHA